jgi:hypothetical protein
MNDDRPASDISDVSMPTLSRAPITTTTTKLQHDEENKINVESIEVSS